MSYEKSAILNQESPTKIPHNILLYCDIYHLLKSIDNTFLMNTNWVYSLLPELARNASIEYERVWDGHYSYEYFWASTRLFFENRVFFNE